MDPDSQVEQLQASIAEQERTLEKLKQEQDKLGAYIKQFKQAISKKANSAQETKNNAEAQKVIAQLQKQIDSANIMLKNYQNQLKNMQKKSYKVKAEDLTVLEQTFRDKETEIRKVREEIKDMQAVKRRQEKVIEKKMKQEDGGKLTRLIEDVRKNKEILDGIREKYDSKKEVMEKKKAVLKQLQQKYIRLCQQKGETPISFQTFKQKRKQRVKEDTNSSKPKTKKPTQTVREIINSQLNLENIDYSQKGLRELRAKKEVAENSLKNAQKKYEKEIEELSRKLEGLQRENESLTTRLMEKTKEKEIIEVEPGEARNHSTRTTRKLTPIK